MYSKQSQLGKNKKPKQRTCKYSKCKNKFEPLNQNHITCDYKCAIDYAKEKEAKRIKKVKSDGRKKLKEEDIGYHKKRARYYCHKYIRLRDKEQPCISCGKPLGNTFHAGHWKSDGNHSAVRYNEDNIHGQCIQCNLYKSGNIKEYETRLIERIGTKRVQSIEDKCKEHKSWSIEKLKGIQELYRRKIKEI